MNRQKEDCKKSKTQLPSSIDRASVGYFFFFLFVCLFVCLFRLLRFSFFCLFVRDALAPVPGVSSSSYLPCSIGATSR